MSVGAKKRQEQLQRRLFKSNVRTIGGQRAYALTLRVVKRRRARRARRAHQQHVRRAS